MSRDLQPAGAVHRPLAPVTEVTAATARTVGRLALFVEGSVMRLIGARLAAASGDTAIAAVVEPSAEPSATELMQMLLARSLDSNVADACEDHHRALLRQLVPDEARILQGLAKGSASATVSIYRRGSDGPVLANASLIGRTAAVTVPSLTPTYVNHLLELGLVSIGAESACVEKDFELLLSEREVREALKAGQFNKLPARVDRGSLTLSPAGEQLWAATQPRNH